MTRSTPIFIAAILAAFLTTACATAAWSQTVNRPMHSKVSPADKQASNQLVSEAIAELTDAEGAYRQGSGPVAYANVNTALGELRQALPIYHGYRVKAMHECYRALVQLSHPRRLLLAGATISAALTDANLALQNAGDEVNEQG